VVTITKPENIDIVFNRNWRPPRPVVSDVWLERDESIVDSNWTVESGMSVYNASVDENQTVVWLSGGVSGVSYELVNTITTDANRTMTRTTTVSVE